MKVFLMVICLSFVFCLSCGGGTDESVNNDVTDSVKFDNYVADKNENDDAQTFVEVETDKIETEAETEVICTPEIEECNGKDDDCNGQTDEGEDLTPPVYFSCLNVGVCQGVKPQCSGGKWNCIYPQSYQIEETSCDNKDNDCNGETDEGILDCCQADEKKSCGIDVGQCEFGEKICQEGGLWGKCEGGIGPKDEICDGEDNNCDGQTDNDAVDCKTYYYDSDGDGYGSEISKCLCAPAGKLTAAKSGDCNDENKDIYPGAQPNCANQCTDGKLNEGEECDDGNLEAEDGCDQCLFSSFFIQKTNFYWKPIIKYFPSENGFDVGIAKEQYYKEAEEDSVTIVIQLIKSPTGEKKESIWQTKTDCAVIEYLDFLVMGEKVIVAWQCLKASVGIDFIEMKISNDKGDDLGFYQFGLKEGYNIFPKIFDFSDGSFILTWISGCEWDIESCIVSNKTFHGQYFDSQGKAVENEKFKISDLDIGVGGGRVVPFLLKLVGENKYATIFTQYDKNLKAIRLFAQFYQTITTPGEKIVLCQKEDDCFSWNWYEIGYGAERFFIVGIKNPSPGNYSIWAKAVGQDGSVIISSLLIDKASAMSLFPLGLINEIPHFVLPEGNFIVVFGQEQGSEKNYSFQRFDKDLVKVGENIPLINQIKYGFTLYLYFAKSADYFLAWSRQSGAQETYDIFGQFIKF